jgi:hypothetical protein
MAILHQGNTLAKVIEANTDVTNLQSNVFKFQSLIGGQVSMNLGSFGALGNRCREVRRPERRPLPALGKPL